MGYASNLETGQRQTTDPHQHALMDLEAASAAVGVSIEALLSSVDAGVVPAYCIDGALRFRPSELPSA